MTAETITTHDDSTLSEQVIDHASDLLGNALEDSPNLGDALGRANENFGQHDLALVTKTEASRDWHNREHSWALTTKLLLEVALIPKNVRQSTQVKIIGRILVHDEKWSKLNNDFREPEEKDAEYYRDRLKAMRRTRR